MGHHVSFPSPWTLDSTFLERYSGTENEKPLKANGYHVEIKLCVLTISLPSSMLPLIVNEVEVVDVIS